MILLLLLAAKGGHRNNIIDSKLDGFSLSRERGVLSLPRKKDMMCGIQISSIIVTWAHSSSLSEQRDEGRQKTTITSLQNHTIISTPYCLDTIFCLSQAESANTIYSTRGISEHSFPPRFVALKTIVSIATIIARSAGPTVPTGLTWRQVISLRFAFSQVAFPVGLKLLVLKSIAEPSASNRTILCY
jgi:hypothetical protein